MNIMNNMVISIHWDKSWANFGEKSVIFLFLQNIFNLRTFWGKYRFSWNVPMISAVFIVNLHCSHGQVVVWSILAFSSKNHFVHIQGTGNYTQNLVVLKMNIRQNENVDLIYTVHHIKGISHATKLDHVLLYDYILLIKWFWKKS